MGRACQILPKTHAIPSSITAKRLSRGCTRYFLQGIGTFNVHSSAVHFVGDGGTRMKVMALVTSSSRVMRRPWATGRVKYALPLLIKVYSYRSHFSWSFHLSTYSRSRARRSERLHSKRGLSTKPAPKRSIQCRKHWEPDITSRRERHTYERIGIISDP